MTIDKADARADRRVHREGLQHDILRRSLKAMTPTFQLTAPVDPSSPPRISVSRC
jgi:hypothetical protein